MGGNDDFADFFVDAETAEVVRELSETFELVIEDDTLEDPEAHVSSVRSTVGETAEELGGLVLQGRFRLDRMLGRGGQATVFEAVDLTDGRTVAFKLLHRACTPKDGRRFAREVAILLDLVHPNIVRILEVGSFNARPWYTMEYVEGQTLDVIQRRLTVIPCAMLLPWIADVVDGLAAAHAMGVVHRDVKPSNVLIGRADGRARLLDFGSARVGELRSSLSDAGFALGTPAFMAPEVIRGEERITPAADLYAVGVMLYEGTTGCRPFAGDLVGPLLMRILTEKPMPPSEWGPVRPALETLILDLLAKKPKVRPSDPARLARQLRMLATI